MKPLPTPMSNIITVGFITEGTTDIRFLSGVIRRTFEAIAVECTTDIDVFAVEPIEVDKTNISDDVHKATRKAFKDGVLVVCVHTDADNNTDANAFTHRINPAFERVRTDTAPDLCRTLVPIVPVHMTEAWMLADKPTLKYEMDTTLSDGDLCINRPPERIVDPKECIKEAIRLSLANRAKRHRHSLTISDLYEPLGAKTGLAHLEALPSYQKFQEAVREAFRQLNYLH